jgi:hypothetical protein
MLDIDGLKEKVRNKVTHLKDSHLPNMGAKTYPLEPEKGEITRKTIVEGYHWAGLTKAEIVGHYRNLHALGVQQKQYYIVKFKAYKNNALSSIPLIENELSGWLATEVTLPILQVENDTKRVGNYSFNHVTGRQAPEITITMIETKDNLVLESIRQIQNVMCNKDGTFGLPSQYSLWIEVYLYGRDQGIAYPKSVSRYLCYPSQLNIDTGAADSGALTLPITFTQSRPFMNL